MLAKYTQVVVIKRGPLITLMRLSILVVSLGLFLPGTMTQVYGLSVREYMTESQKFIDQKKYENALEVLQMAQRQYPDRHEIANLVGVLHIELEQYQEAERVMRELLSVAPEFAGAHFNYGELYFKQKNYPEARKYFQRSMDIKGTDQTAVNSFKLFLCDLLTGMTMVEDAPFLTSSADVGHPLAYYARAALYFHAGDEEEAQTWLQSAKSIYPLRKNLVYMDSMVTLGWVAEEDFDQMQAEYDQRMGKNQVAGNDPAASDSELQAEVLSDVEAAERLSEIESILPSLE